MIRGARGLFRSARQIRRAKTQRTKSGGSETRRTVCDLAREEQKHAFGRRYTETMPRVLATGVGMLDIGAIDALNILLQDLSEDDDDGR
ncbi:hypothetical protein PHMEG_00022704 [Phytophthora megakarya]|uniref:Uncharacterized protein n=1 Tax=Phytophthora megakarya TaxID=4795 RepID=A0A225VII7_9STRA|nr:hypothetical protein PHMEG_00022704 [Phytophthora megakarya]